ncbi:MAG: glycosyltransferase [Flavobacterium sp.]|nr:glycosyltransferase [Flavobacterium sp.]
MPEIIFLTSFPPRECGIATYSQDLVKALNNKFKKTFNIKICAVVNDNDKNEYNDEVKYILNTDCVASFDELSQKISDNDNIKMILVQHEFGFYNNNESAFIKFIYTITKPIVVAFHTILPNPNDVLKLNVQQIAHAADALIVMTKSSKAILEKDYKIDESKINVIAHGTHLVQHFDKNFLKDKYDLSNRKILSTFGLLSSGKSIETTLYALPEIIKKNPDVLFLIIGKTHPTVFTKEGEVYREFLNQKIEALNLQNNVKFINKYLQLNELLEYLQLTDIYLFTSKDPNQAVSGTFAYAISCGCPIISTPIPHAIEVLKDDSGIIIDFENPKQLAREVNNLLENEKHRKDISLNGLHKIAPNSWENSAIQHALLFQKITHYSFELNYKIPEINLNHLKNMTTDFAMIQFAIINQPDINTGFTLDDNARALVATCQHFELTGNNSDMDYIIKYYEFIDFCLQKEGFFLNYVDVDKNFTRQNSENLADSNGRAIWALGYLLSISHLLSKELIANANQTLQFALLNVNKIHSTRSMAFIIKGVFYANKSCNSFESVSIIKHFADKLVQMYRHESKPDWEWFESYLTYGNSILPEAMLCAYLSTGNLVYKNIAEKSFNFLLLKIFTTTNIKVISNRGWLQSDQKIDKNLVGGEQPIDVAYTILALSKFFDVYKKQDYLRKIKIAFSWFLGNNHLHQIIYNPCTGGCYDGLEDTYVNLNQGAESTVSYLMARLTIEKYAHKKHEEKKIKTKITQLLIHSNIN